MSGVGINWMDIARLSNTRINWSDISILSNAGVNWSDMKKLTDASVNWNNMATMTKAGVNWSDLDRLTRAGINWADLAYMTGIGINWTDMRGSTISGINWTNLAAMTSASINWNQISTLSARIDSLITDIGTLQTVVDSLNGKIGKTGDARTASLYGLIEYIGTTISGLEGLKDAGALATAISQMQVTIGAQSDASTAGTLFGVINEIDAYAKLIGSTTDATSTKTLFGKLAFLASKSSQLLQEVQDTRDELGAKGKTETAFQALSKINTTVTELKNTVDTLGFKKEDADEITKKIIDAIVNATNQSAQSLGLKMDEIHTLDQVEAADIIKMNKKLAELKAVLAALVEAQGQNKAVVKSWMESE
jgi:hypothetical protein